jgi:hypothetical protein
MKKFLAVLFVAGLLSASAFAGTTDTLSLTGTITQVIDVDFTDTSANFTLSAAGVGGVTTGDVTVKSNRKGYTIRLSSANDGKLVNATDTTSVIPYTVQVLAGTTNPITFGASTIVNNLESAAAPTTAGILALTATNYRTPVAGKTFKLVFVTVPGSDILEGSSYADTLTVTIIATA